MPADKRVLMRNEYAVMVRDAFPVSPSHSQIIALRHVNSFFETMPTEREALLDAAKVLLDSEFNPAGYNIGVNDGPATGQTIAHRSSGPAWRCPMGPA